MVLFYTILGIIILNVFSFTLLYLSILEIEVEELNIDTKKKINKYLIYIRLKLLKRITWARIKIDNEKVKKFKTMNNKILNKISKDLKKQIVDKKSLTNLTSLKCFKITIKQVHLKLSLGLLNPVTTSFATSIIGIVLSNIIAKKIEEYNKENCIYKIEPIYSIKPELKLNLNCIIYVKLVHIISIIYMLNKKGSVKNGKFSSDRRAYESIHV